MRISPQRGQPHRVAPAKSTSFYGNFSLGAKTYSARFTPIDQEIFAAYGINQRYFRKGGWIAILRQDVYEECAQKFDSENADALYPFNLNYEEVEFESILRGEEDARSEEWRVIALPETFSAKTLLHEILHDIYLGGAFDSYDREYFSDKILACLRRASRDNNLKEFFEKVNTISGLNYTIPKSQSNQTVKNEIEFQIFANECFAYAAQNIRYSKWQVPEEIRFFFSSYRLFINKTKALKPLASTSQPLAHAPA